MRKAIGLALLLMAGINLVPCSNAVRDVSATSAVASHSVDAAACAAAPTTGDTESCDFAGHHCHFGHCAFLPILHAFSVAEPAYIQAVDSPRTSTNLARAEHFRPPRT